VTSVVYVHRCRLSVKLHLRDGRTKRRVSLSVVSVRGIHPMGERTAMLHRNSRGRGKNPGSANKYTKFKIIATRCHILRLKCTKFDSRRLSIRLSVRLLDGVCHLAKSAAVCTYHGTDSAGATAGLALWLAATRPSAWNSLSETVRNPNATEAAFRRLLKTFLFAVY